MKETEMSDVLKTHASDAVSKGFSAARRRGVVTAVLASLAMLASSIQAAFGAVTQTRDVDDPGRIAYESQQSIEGQVVVFPKVPAGHRLVIQHVSAEVNFNQNVHDLVQVLVAGGQGSSNFLAPFSLSVTFFDQLVQQYVDAGRTPNVQFVADFGLTLISGGSVTLTGYLLDCTAAPCATIAP
jgi:hypothetical protein